MGFHVSIPKLAIAAFSGDQWAEGGGQLRAERKASKYFGAGNLRTDVLRQHRTTSRQAGSKQPFAMWTSRRGAEPL